MRYLRWWHFGLLALFLGGCGKSVDHQVADAVRSLDGLDLDRKQVEILNTRESGESLLAEVRVTTAVRLEKKEGRWELSEVRLGDRRWEKADHILAVLQQQRTETTRRRLARLQEAMQRHLEKEGVVPQVSTFGALVDVLYPKYLEEVVRLDAWSHPFVYQVRSPSDYDLRSAGADGREGTLDDVRLEGAP